MSAGNTVFQGQFVQCFELLSRPYSAYLQIVLDKKGRLGGGGLCCLTLRLICVSRGFLSLPHPPQEGWSCGAGLFFISAPDMFGSPEAQVPCTTDGSGVQAKPQEGYRKVGPEANAGHNLVFAMCNPLLTLMYEAAIFRENSFKNTNIQNFLGI